MTYCAAINCIDGRVQLPIIRYLQEHVGARYVDVATEAGPVRTLSRPEDSEAKRCLLRGVRISLRAHASQVVAVVAHEDCAGNPVGKEQQLQELAVSVEAIAREFPTVSVLGLWIDDQGSVTEILRSGSD